MHKLTRIIAPALVAPVLVAIAAVGSAGIASAQPMPGYERGYDQGYGRNDFRANQGRVEAIRNQINQIEQRINRNDNRDRISEREAAGLRREIRDVRNQFRAFSRNGLDNREFRTLQIRIDRVKARLQVERHDRDGRRW